MDFLTNYFKKPVAILFAVFLFSISCDESNHTDRVPGYKLKEEDSSSRIGSVNHPVYFQVAELEPYHGDSYLLPLTDPRDIEQAREIIASGSEKIILAEITNDSTDHYYKNYDLKTGHAYSWHISQFLEFSDTSAEILDGWPRYVEGHYDEWVENTKGENGKGRIGFWSYTIVDEVIFVGEQ